jgi:ribosome-binding ATPase YchF (GTP1/OBG family)
MHALQTGNIINITFEYNNKKLKFKVIFMEIGLIGKPSSGKSSFFKAATMVDVPIDARPFTTIKPNVGVGHVVVDCVEKEFGVNCMPKYGKCLNAKRYIPVKIWDVAGIVPKAHEGRGLGLKFLDDIRQASVLIHIVDASGKTDEEGNPTEFHDPVEDVEFVEKEIDYWFMEILSKAIEKYKTKMRTEKIDVSDLLFQQLSGLGVKKESIEKALSMTSIEDLESFARTLRMVSKPIIIAANKIDVDGAEENYIRLKKAFPDNDVIPVSAASEIALRTAEEKGFVDYFGNDFIIKKEMDEMKLAGLKRIKEKVLDKYGSTGVQECLNVAVFKKLQKIVVYPVADATKLTDSKGNVLPDAYIVDKGMKLKEFAYMIHTDIGQNFIGGIDARSKRKLSAEYELRNKDVVEILFKR